MNIELTEEQIKLIEIKNLIFQYAGIDGAHHKQWLITEIAKIIAGDNYEQFVKEYCDGEDGPNTYEWDEGIAP